MRFFDPVQGSSLVSFAVIKGLSCAIWAVLERVQWFWKPPLERTRMAGANSASRPQSHRAGSECQTPQQNLKVKASLRFWSREAFAFRRSPRLLPCGGRQRQVARFEMLLHCGQSASPATCSSLVFTRRLNPDDP